MRRLQDDGASGLIVYILDPFGHVRPYAETLARNLADNGTRVRLLTAGWTETRGPLKRDGSEAILGLHFLRWTARLRRAAPVLPLFLFMAPALLEYVLDLFRLRRFRESASVFHWQWLPLPLLTLPLLRLFRVPVDVLTVHDLVPSGRADRSRLGWTARASLASARRLIVHGRCLKDEALALAPEVEPKTHIIPHGLLFEGEGTRRVARPGRSIGFVGLIKEYKGLETLLDAWGRVYPAAKSGHRTLSIRGDCRMGRAARVRLLAALRRSPDVRWDFGFLDEEAFKAAVGDLDLLVLPYLRCSQSGVALAALGLGVPLLVSDAGALPELLQGEQERWIFRAGDSAALAEKLKDFFGAPEAVLEGYRSWIRGRAGRYSGAAVARAHLRVFGSLERGSLALGSLEAAL